MNIIWWKWKQGGQSVIRQRAHACRPGEGMRGKHSVYNFSVHLSLTMPSQKPVLHYASRLTEWIETYIGWSSTNYEWNE